MGSIGGCRGWRRAMANSVLDVMLAVVLMSGVVDVWLSVWLLGGDCDEE